MGEQRVQDEKKESRKIFAKATVLKKNQMNKFKTTFMKLSLIFLKIIGKKGVWEERGKKNLGW